MNKKLFISACILALLLSLTTITSVTYASEDGDNDATETHDMNDDNSDDDKGGERKEMHKEIQSAKKAAHDDWKEGRTVIHKAFYSQLGSDIKDAIETIHKTYEPLFEAIKNDATKTLEEKKAAADALHAEMHAKIKALLPTDLQDDFDAMKAELKTLHDTWLTKKDELKTEWKNKKDEWKAKRENRRAKMKGKMRVVFGKLDNVLAKFEGKKKPEQLVTTYTNLITKLDEKIATLETDTDLYTLLTTLSEDLNDRVNELKAQ